MKSIHAFIYALGLLFVIQSAAFAQTTDLSEIFKKHLNETVKEVQDTKNATEKRAVLDNSFVLMIDAIERIETRTHLTSEEMIQLNLFKNDIVEKRNELLGLDGFDEVLDKDLDDFSEYAQQSFELANRTITMGVGTAVVILLILILLL